MRKVALELDTLAVTTFATTDDVPVVHVDGDPGSIERCSVTCPPSAMAPCHGTLNGADTCHFDCWA